MKIKVLFSIILISIMSYSVNAQRGVRIGYIDTEYILENVPEYQEASSQLESKIQKWKTEIEGKLASIEQQRTDLSNESVLLTPELVKEREEDILFEEKEILDYQQKRFGPNGDLMIQKKQLVQPIQDQIFAAVQDIAANKKFDFIVDKAELNLLFSADRFDISEQVLRSITRASKRKQIQTKKERKAAEAEEVVPVINEAAEAKKKEVEANKAARAKSAEEKKQAALEARETKKKEAAARRQKILDDRAKKKAERDGTTSSKKKLPFDVKIDEKMENGTPFEDEGKEDGDSSKETTKDKAPDTKKKQEENVIPKTREERKKELEERKRKILEARAKAKAEREAKKKAQDSIKNNNNN